MTIYDFAVNNINGENIPLAKYKGKVLLIVNTASKCRFTTQFEDLQKLYERYSDKGLEILGFPCNQFLEQEPGTSKQIQSFCSLNYGVTFPLFEKVKVNGESAHPLYKFLIEMAPFKGLDTTKSSNRLFEAMVKEIYPEYSVGNAVRWNFTKFLVDQDGNVIDRFEPPVSPFELEPHIEKLFA